MNRENIGKISDCVDDISYSSEESCKLTRKLIRRVEYLTLQQELTNNILIEMARADSREDLNNRLDMLLAIEEV